MQVGCAKDVRKRIPTRTLCMSLDARVGIRWCTIIMTSADPLTELIIELSRSMAGLSLNAVIKFSSAAAQLQNLNTQ